MVESEKKFIPCPFKDPYIWCYCMGAGSERIGLFDFVKGRIEG